MDTTNTPAKRLLITAIGAAVLGISIAAVPAALADTHSHNGGLTWSASKGKSGEGPDPVVATPSRP